MDLFRYTGTDLMRLYKDVMRELREKKITRSSINPTAEYLMSRALDLERARRSTMGYDAEDGDGVRHEIKGRQLILENASFADCSNTISLFCPGPSWRKIFPCCEAV